MIRNNIVAFIFHILLIVLSTFYLILIVSLSPYIGSILINPIVRGVLSVLWTAMYVYIGSKMTIKHRRKTDFSCGILIALIGLVLWGYSLISAGIILDVPEKISIPLNVYLNPIYQICFLLDIRFNQLIRLISCFVPTILIGIGIKYKRYKYTRVRVKAV